MSYAGTDRCPVKALSRRLNFNEPNNWYDTCWSDPRPSDFWRRACKVSSASSRSRDCAYLPLCLWCHHHVPCRFIRTEPARRPPSKAGHWCQAVTSCGDCCVSLIDRVLDGVEERRLSQSAAMAIRKIGMKNDAPGIFASKQSIEADIARAEPDTARRAGLLQLTIAKFSASGPLALALRTERRGV
ncbi:hypothetical protein ACVIHF_000747 [Bradyrhizobium sp. USDA 4506]